MTSPAERERAPRGLRRTSTSPRFCGVAKRPISAPVRRENAATSGVAAITVSTRRSSRSVSASAVPGGVW